MLCINNDHLQDTLTSLIVRLHVVDNFALCIFNNMYVFILLLNNNILLKCTLWQQHPNHFNLSCIYYNLLIFLFLKKNNVRYSGSPVA